MSKNAAGLKPSETKALNERPLQSHEKQIVMALNEMYSCSPNETTFSIYASDAVFNDPVTIAKGPKSIEAQFVGLTRIFPRAEIRKCRVLENPPTVLPSTLLIDQDVSYYRNPESSPVKTLNSLLTITLDEFNKIKGHVEEWDHQKTVSRGDGFLGMLRDERKKLTASLTEMFVGKD